MLKAALLFCHGDALEEWILRRPAFADGLARHARGEIAAACGDVPALVLGLDGARPGAFESLAHGGPVVFLDRPVSSIRELCENLPAAVRQWLGPNTDLLLVAPARGSVGRERIRLAVEALAARPEVGGVASCPAFPTNCNPAWLHASPTGSGADEGGVLVEFKPKMDFSPHFRDENGQELTAGQPPKGSQWLPEFCFHDGAVTVVRPGHPGPWDHMAAPSPDGAPLFYRLPVFQFHEGQALQWDLDEAQALALLARPGYGKGDSDA